MSALWSAFTLGVVCTSIALVLWLLAHLLYERMVP